MKRPQFWYVPPCCRRFRAPAPSPPACASRPPSPPRPRRRSGPSGTLSGGKGGSHRQPPCGRTAHLRLCARGQFRLFAPARVSSFPSRGSRAAARKLAGVRRAAARRQPSNHPSPRTIGVPGRGPSAVAARACALRRASGFALCRPLISAPCALLRLFAFVPRAREIQPLCARALVSFWAGAGAVRLWCPRRVRGGGAWFWLGPPVLRGGPAPLLSPRRSCAGAGAALVRLGGPRAPRGFRGLRGVTSSAPPLLGHFRGLRGPGLRGCAAELRPAVRALAARACALRAAAKAAAPLRSYTELTIPGHGSV